MTARYLRRLHPASTGGTVTADERFSPVAGRPASHGCVRIPLDISYFFHRLIHVTQRGGTPVYISGHV